MSVRTELELYGSRQTYRLIVEPWADEFLINPRDKCKIVAVHDEVAVTFAIEHHAEFIVVWINEGGAYFEFWRDGVQER